MRGQEDKTNGEDRTYLERCYSTDIELAVSDGECDRGSSMER
jgi:hypothetical protein